MANNFFSVRKDYARKFLPCLHDLMNYESCLQLMLPLKLLIHTAPHFPALLPGSIWPLTNPPDTSKVFCTFVASSAPTDSLTIISCTTVLVALRPGSLALVNTTCVRQTAAKNALSPPPCHWACSEWAMALGMPPLVPSCWTKGQRCDRHRDAAAGRLSSGSTLFGKTT